MMKSIDKALGILYASSFLLVASESHAAERGFYVGLNYGQVDKDVTSDVFDLTAAGIFDRIGFETQSSTTAFDTSDMGYSFLGGLRLNEYLAFEGGFVELGEVAYQHNASGISHSGDVTTEEGIVDHSDDAPVNWRFRVRSPSRGLSLSALGIYPVTYRSEIFLRGGVLISSNRWSLSISDDLGTLTGETDNETSTDFLVGAGASYTFADIYAVRLEYQRIFDHGAKELDEGDLDVITLGITVTF